MYDVYLLLLIIIFIWSYIVSFNFRGLEVPQLLNPELVAKVLNRRRGKTRPKYPEGMENFKLIDHVPAIFTSGDGACCEITIEEEHIHLAFVSAMQLHVAILREAKTL